MIMTISFNSKYKYLKIYLSYTKCDILFPWIYTYTTLYYSNNFLPITSFNLQVSTYVLIIVKFESQLII